MTKKQAHEILYLLWYNRYLDSNFTEPHSEYDWALNMLVYPDIYLDEEFDDYNFEQVSLKKAKKIQLDLYEGCYFLLNKRKIVYVGVSTCIYTRLKQHKIENLKEWDSVKYIKEHDRNKALEMENYYIKKYRPKYNIIGIKDNKIK